MLSRRSFLSGSLCLAPGLAAPTILTGASRGPVHALIIGSGRYDKMADVPHAAADAALIARTLRGLGVEVSEASDLPRESILVALSRFRLALSQSRTAVFYYVGHGMMRGGITHLLGTDFEPERPAQGQSVPLNGVLRAISDRPRSKALFLDAGRRNAAWDAQARAFAGVLAPINQFAPIGTHISYATQPGAPAPGSTGGPSAYAWALSQALARPGLSMEEVATQVNLAVVQETQGQQVPWAQSMQVTPLVLNQGNRDS